MEPSARRKRERDFHVENPKQKKRNKTGNEIYAKSKIINQKQNMVDSIDVDDLTPKPTKMTVHNLCFSMLRLDFEEKQAKQQADEEKTSKQKNAERMRRKRSSLTKGQKEEIKKKDAQRKSKQRATQSKEQKDKLKKKDAERKRHQRARQPAKQKEKQRKSDAVRKRKSRATQSTKQKQKELKSDALRKRKKRATQSKKQKEKERNSDAARKRKKRATQSKEEKENEAQRKKRQRKQTPATYKTALMQSRDIFEEEKQLEAVQQHSLGRQSAICDFCQAYMWEGERSVPNKNVFSLCCCQGGIQKLKIPKVNQVLRKLFTGKHKLSELFYKNIRAINLALAMTSEDTDVHLIWEKQAPITFKIHGHLRHYVDTVVPKNETDPDSYQFSQIYLLDPETQLDKRSQLNGLDDPKVIKLVEILQKALLKENLLIQQFKSCFEIAKETPNLKKYEIVISQDKIQNGVHPKCSAKPQTDQIAYLITKPEKLSKKLRAVRMKSRKPENESSLYTHIPEKFGYYDALSYPVYIPKGDLTWSHHGIKREKQFKTKPCVTAREYYSYVLQQRVGVFNQFFHGRRLFQQYLLDMWAKIHQFELLWINKHQKDVRADLYTGVVDAAHTNNLKNIGKKIILPSAHTTSPRWYFERYQDALHIVYRKGLPSLFITFTCNDEWDEIKEAIKKSNATHAKDRPDIQARVFRLKLIELMRKQKVKFLARQSVIYGSLNSRNVVVRMLTF